MSINRPYEPEILYIVNVARPGGGEDIDLENAATLEIYNRDPDEYAARYYGLTKLQYIEWITLDGNPLCGTRTAKGDLCRNQSGPGQLGAADWLLFHRKSTCSSHARKDPDQ